MQILAMLGKFLHIITLFAYLNLLTYDSFSSTTGQVLHAGESVVEFLLDDVLDMEPVDSSPEEKVLLQDDYRIFHPNYQILSVFIFVFGVVFSALTFAKMRNHPFYRSKTRCVLGYHLFLYRYRPF